MAVIIVSIEYGSHLVMPKFGMEYLVAVPESMAAGILFNWHYSRYACSGSVEVWNPALSILLHAALMYRPKRVLTIQ
jgi:hypothetical protein